MWREQCVVGAKQFQVNTYSALTVCYLQFIIFGCTSTLAGCQGSGRYYMFLIMYNYTLI